MNRKFFLISSILILPFTAAASVSYDDAGVGFVGKGDIQSVFDWNNQGLQNNAVHLQFRMLMPSAGTWKCAGFNPQGHWVVQSQSSESQSVNTAVNFDSRKNKTGQITGFILSGMNSQQSPTFTSMASCEAPNDKWTSYGLVDGSVSYANEDAEFMLQASVDGTTWVDLPISY